MSSEILNGRQGRIRWLHQGRVNQPNLQQCDTRVTTDCFGLKDSCFGMAVQPDGQLVGTGLAFVMDCDIGVAVTPRG